MSAFPGQPMSSGPTPRPGGPLSYGGVPTAAPDDNAGKSKKKKDKGPKEPSSRGGAGNRLALILGILLAIVAFTVVLAAGGSNDDEVPTQLVVVAARDIGPLTPLAADLFTAVPATQDMIDGLTVDTDTDDDGLSLGEDAPDPVVTAGQYMIVGSLEEIADLEVFTSDRHVRYPIPAGAPLFADYLEDPDAARADLAPDERLLTIRASIGRTFAGRLAAGDHVDIIATNGDIASLVGIDAEIVAVDVSEGALESAADTIANPEEGTVGDLDRDDLVPADPIPGLFTLRVRTVDLTRLAVLDASTNLTLAYRDPSATDLVAAAPASVLEVMCAHPTTFNRAVEGQVLYFDADGVPLVLNAPTTPDAPGELQVLETVATFETPATSIQVPVTPLVDPLGTHMTVDGPDGPELLWQPTEATAGFIATGGEIIYDADGNPTITTLATDQPLPVECLDLITGVDGDVFTGDPLEGDDPDADPEVDPAVASPDGP